MLWTNGRTAIRTERSELNCFIFKHPKLASTRYWTPPVVPLKRRQEEMLRTTKRALRKIRPSKAQREGEEEEKEEEEEEEEISDGDAGEEEDDDGSFALFVVEELDVESGEVGPELAAEFV